MVMSVEEISSWKSRVLKAQAYQEQQHRMWRDAVDLYNCDFFDKRFGLDPERVDVNFSNWYIDNLIPLVYFRDPYMFVKARNEKYSGFAETIEEVINHSWRELGLKQENKRVIKSAFMMPPGWIKVGYTAQLGQDVAEIDSINEKNAVKILKDAIKGVFNIGEKKELTPEEKGELNIYIKEESVFASWIPSWNMIMPEGYHVIDKMPWLCEFEDVAVVDFKSNPTYKNKENLTPDRVSTNRQSSGKAVDKVPFAGEVDQHDDSDIIRLYHVWDRRNQRRFTLSMRSELPHFEGKWPYDIEGFPYIHLSFDESLPTDQDSNPYPANCLKPIMPQIVEMSNLRTQMTKWRRRASAYILAQKGLVTEDDMQQITETEGLQVCLVSNKDAFTMTPGPALPTEVFSVEQAITKDLQMGTNMGQMMFAPMAGQRTATQAQISQSGLQLKASSRVDVVEDYTVRLARVLCQLAWQFYDKKKVEEIIGEPVSESMWPTLPKEPKERRRIIQAELQFRIDAGSTAAPKDETVDRKQFLDAVSILASVAPDRLKSDEIAKIVAKKFKFSRDVDRIVITNDDEEIAAAEQENALLNGDVPQVVTPNENHKIHMEVHMKGGQPTRSMDLHLLDHGKYLGVNPRQGASGGDGGNSSSPQEGDKRPPLKSTNPEVVRQGNTEQSDVYQSVQNMGSGSVAQREGV